MDTQQKINEQIRQINAGQSVELNLSQIALYNHPQIIEKIEDKMRVEFLYLDNCHLQAYPPQVNIFPKLRTLSAKRNYLTSANFSESRLESPLHILSLNSNQIGLLSSNFEQLYPQLVDLDLGNNKIRQIPVFTQMNTCLKGLDLNHNHIEEIPASIDRLSTLTCLTLNNNCITSLPSSITNLQNLVNLFIYENCLEEIPEWVVELSKLEALSISENYYTQVPVFLNKMTQLTTLHLSCAGNPTIRFPDLGDLTNLTDLQLSNCNLTEIPEWIRGMTKLTELNLANNKIKEIPYWFDELENLTHVDLEHNPLKVHPFLLDDMGVHWFATEFIDLI